MSDEPSKVVSKRGKSHIFLILGIFILLAGLFILGFLPRFFQTKKIDGIAALDPLPSATVMVAKQTDKPLEFILPSSTEALHVTPIWARTNGYLVDLAVDIGDVVKEGELLALLDTPEVDQQYDQAVSELASAEGSKDIAKISSDRWQELYKKNAQAISKQEVDERTVAYKVAGDNVLSAQANVLRLQKLRDFKNIVAPFNGIIIERNVDLGSLITAGSNGNPQKLFVIAETDIIRVFVSVPQYFFRSIKEGVEGVVTIREFPNEKFMAKVVRYAKALDPVARTMLTELHIDNKDGKILAGLYAEVRFVLKPDVPYFIVPTQAVIIRAGDPKVAIVDENDVVHLKPVKIGLDYGKTLEIVEGINENDRIVINPNEKIREGVKVEVIIKKPS
jgi:RND family efflux transporter MFP subunit